MTLTSQTITPTNELPTLVSAPEARAYRGPDSFGRVGDFNVAWLDASHLHHAAHAVAGGVDASPDWLDGYDLLLAYVTKTGALPTKDTIVNGYALGKYVQRQRTAWNKRGTGHREALASDKVAALEAVPRWKWKAHRGRPHDDDLWLDLFVDYLDALDRGVVGPDGLSGRFFYDWSIRQQDAYRDGGMPAYRRTLLALVPGWRWRTRHDPGYGETVDLDLSGTPADRLVEHEVFDGLARAQAVAALTWLADLHAN